MYNTEKGIEFIKYGEIHLYFPLKFNTDKSYDELCDEIKKSDFIFDQEYHKKINDKLSGMLLPVIKEYMNSSDYDKAAPIKLNNFNENNDKIISEKEINSLNEQGFKIELDISDNSVILYPTTEEFEALKMRLSRYDREFNVEKEIYSFKFINSHNRFILLPLVITLSNNEKVRLQALLYVFKNKMGVLKLELPLKNVTADPLLNNNLGEYIASISCAWRSDINPKTSIFSIPSFYLNALSLNDKCIILDNVIKHIILIDFLKMPNSVNKKSTEFLELLYRILQSPIYMRSFDPYKEKARIFINEHSWGNDMCEYIFNGIGGCVSFIDKRQLNSFLHNSNQINIDELDKSLIYNDIAADLCINIELPLLIVMLKKINNTVCLSEKMEINYNGKTIDEKLLLEIQNQYNENNMFICALQEYCFGSVSELIDFAIRNMPLYLKQEITGEKLNSIDEMILRKQNIRELNFQHFISNAGLLFSLFFGLPSIYETLSILRSAFLYIYPGDIPYLSITCISSILWFAVILVLLIKTNGIHIK